MALLAVILLFFFSGAFQHCDLHSFPTRRSSDLCLDADLPESGTLLWILDYAGSAGGNQCHPRARKDRKSTRLNSSHVAISYAVFCLKKKTEREIIETSLGTSRYRKLVSTMASQK